MTTTTRILIEIVGGDDELIGYGVATETVTALPNGDTTTHYRLDPEVYGVPSEAYNAIDNPGGS
jgi:hypothetical protein